jgi:serine/threonine protein kinase
MIQTESEILKAVDAIHSLGVIHGDIRSDNILVGKDGSSAWIVDFEFAEIMEGLDDKDAKITQEIGDVKELLRKIKNPGGSDGLGGNEPLETGNIVSI